MKSRSRRTTHLLLLLLTLLFFFYYYSNSPSHLCFAADTISSGQSLNLNQTLISKGGTFELGYFTPGTSLNYYYIGIWYKNVSIQTVVWVANRDTPLTDPSSSEFKLSENGNLVLLNQLKFVIWSTESASNANVSFQGVLGDDGNFVLRTGVRPSDVYWQSFDYPTDTFLPGAKIGYNSITNKIQTLTSWRTSNDPARGLYSLQLERYEDQFIIKSQENQYWSSGAWNGETFSLVPEIRLNFIFNFSYFKNENESYFTYSLYNTSILSRLVMDLSGQIRQYTWAETRQSWFLFWSQPRTQCDVYRYCGSFGVCNQMSLPFCTCLEGFVPRSPKDWDMSDFSGGCERRISLPCGIESGFLQMQLVKWPDNQRSFDVPTAEHCKQSCLNDCSCSAFAFNISNICLLWNGDLFNLQQFQDGDGGVKLSIQLRLAASEIQSLGGEIEGMNVEFFQFTFAQIDLRASSSCFTKY